MYRSRFDPESERAQRGLAFQKEVQDAIDPWFQRTWNTREWLLLHDKCLTEIQLNSFEHTWGDIVIIDLNVPYPIFIECVSLKGENSIFPEHKIRKFSGENKYYCFGWDDQKIFVHSKVWNSYASKCESLEYYRRFSRSNILGLRKKYSDPDEFCEWILQIEKRVIE